MSRHCKLNIIQIAKIFVSIEVANRHLTIKAHKV